MEAAVLAAALAATGLPASATGRHDGAVPVQLGPRPFFLVEDMADSSLKTVLQQCAARREHYQPSKFSIGHRGAPLQFPEHTRESYQAAARMGAGVLECDVAFTKDKELVCRHAQNDLHTTTDILATPLAEKCSKPFTPATFDAAGKLLTPATAECRTSDITLAEFKTLRGKMDAFDPRATTAAAYLGGTADFRTNLYSGPTSGTLLTHKESIELFRSLGVDMTPELKTPVVPMPFDGFTQEAYAQKLIDEYKAAGIAPQRVWPQSFLKDDVIYWVNREPAFGRQAVYLDDAETVADLPDAAELAGYKTAGISIVAPPTFALLALDGNGEIVPSQYARDARNAGLDIITWTIERSGVLADGDNGFYLQTVDSAIKREGDVYRVIDTLARHVGVLGIFSDWPATVSFYANCKGLR
ncbi:MAG: glycerophosphodiester phosphodiesterase family protein [Lautropia sp.]